MPTDPRPDLRGTPRVPRAGDEIDRPPALPPVGGADGFPPIGELSVGMIAPYDFALDREVWRWVPDTATVHLTRTPFSPLPVSIEQAETVSDPDMVTQCTTDLVTIQPEVVAYACTSGSFVGGVAGERALVSAMIAAGAPSAVTTSSALLEALSHLDLHRIGIATPYNEAITASLATFLGEAGVSVVGTAYLGLTGRIWTTPYAVTSSLAREAARAPGCEAVFVSCTNLATYDVIGELERELGIPVLTANQVTMWAALRRAGLDARSTDGQLLLADAPACQRPQTE